MHRHWRFILGLITLGLCWWASATPSYAHHTIEGTDEITAAPPNFIVRTVVSELTLPTDMVILPSGDFLVTEKGVGAGISSVAQVRLVRGGILRTQPVVTLSVNAEEDSGLLGIVLDPQFATNSYFYLWYSTGEDSLAWDGTSYNRLSRFVFDAASGTANPAGETIVLDKVQWSTIHSGGGLVFDAQGNLIITTGDAGSSPNAPNIHLAQSPTSLNGKVLRIHPRPEGGYDVPTDNPFLNQAGTRPEIYAFGLRNPFRITQRVADQNIYLLDVGQDTWEEVNRLTPGVNYGWPYREGRCEIYQREPNCTPTPVEFTDPVLVYVHPNGSGAGITAMDFYEGDQWPVQYRGKLFFADFNSEWVRMIDLDDPNQTIVPFITGIGALVDMEATAAGIYAVSIYDQSIKFIYYDRESNHPPTVEMSTTLMSGQAPLNVRFTSLAQDADNDDLRYMWNFADGSNPVTTSEPSITHVYTHDGDFLATLQVTDEDDGKSEIKSQLIQVYSGAFATVVQENLTVPGRTLYHGGDHFRFSAAREGGTVGLDPTAPYAWTVLLHHNEHAHVLFAGVVTNTVTLDIPVEAHALGVPLWYEIQLSMRTESGQVLKITHELRPQTTIIQAQSWPGPTVITLDQQMQGPDDQTLVIVGQMHVLEASERIIHDGKVGIFKNWVVTEGWPAANIAGDTEIVTERRYELVVPETPKTYVAFYEYSGSARVSFLPTVSK